MLWLWEGELGEQAPAGIRSERAQLSLEPRSGVTAGGELCSYCRIQVPWVQTAGHSSVLVSATESQCDVRVAGSSPPGPPHFPASCRLCVHSPLHAISRRRPWSWRELSRPSSQAGTEALTPVCPGPEVSWGFPPGLCS